MQCRFVLIFFFFSSRRRHTRFDCDWSSDVCSSDLACHAGVTAAKARGWQVLVTDHHLPGPQLPPADVIVDPNLDGDAFPSKSRSEEHTSELQSQSNLVCRLLLEKKNKENHSYDIRDDRQDAAHLHCSLTSTST